MRIQLLLLFYFWGYALGSAAQSFQTKEIHGQSINLPAWLSSDKQAYEFSAMTHWQKGYMLLIPATRDITRNDGIYAIPDAEIRKYIEDPAYKIPPMSIRKIVFDHTSFLRYVKDAHGVSTPVYDGIEAAVAIGDTLYLSVERHRKNDCSGPNYCSIVKSRIDDEHNMIVSEKEIHLDNPCTEEGNDGFESMVFLPARDSILVVFERDVPHNAWTIDLGLNGKKECPFPAFPNGTDRLPELFLTADDRLIGLFSFYGKKDPKCVYRLAQINIDNASASVLATLDAFGCRYNWEGAQAFDNHIILINDNQNGSSTDSTKLIYYKLE